MWTVASQSIVLCTTMATASLVCELIPQSVRFLFPFPNFNEMQCRVLRTALQTDNNMVVAAPTGSGKTAILEMALAKLLLMHSQQRAFRCVYIAPSKALCQQRWVDWRLKFEPLGLQVLEVTGDVDWKEVSRHIASTSIIITTPEKWDSLTRMWRENAFSLGVLNLLLIDEVHHLGEERGAVLEAVVVRLMMINQQYMQDLPGHYSHKMRIVALSATLPNISDVGKWLKCDADCVFYFDEQFRPVPLRVLCFGYECRGNQYLFEKSLDRYLNGLINAYSDRRQTIIFCASKKGAQNCAVFLKLSGGVPSIDTARDPWFRGCCAQIQDQSLAALLPFGVAYHHAGLPPDDRMIIEQLFLQGRVRVLCSTSTLAHGMNLPAHLVIVKGTLAWRGGTKGYERLKRSDVIQMLGRAGRPGFDDEGIAVIMTSLQDQAAYSSMSLHADVVESNLQHLLYETLVAEISQRVITSLRTCIEWMKATFYSICLEANPPPNCTADPASLEAFIRNLCLSHLRELSAAKIIFCSDDCGSVAPLAESHIMSRSLVRFKTMQLLMSMGPCVSLQQLIRALSFSTELHKPLRRTDKKVLNELMKGVRFPGKERVQELHHKVYVLLQASVGLLEIKDFSLRIEQAEMVDSASRLLKGLQELAIHNEWGALLDSVILFERSLRTRLWEGPSSCQFQQCAGLASSTIKALQDHGIHHVFEIYGLSLQQVQQRLSCSPTDAKQLLHFSASLHHCRLVAYLTQINSEQLRITAKLAEPGDQLMGLQAIPFQLLCYHSITGRLVCFRRLEAGTKHAEFAVVVEDLPETMPYLRCRIFGTLVGADFSVGPTLLPDDRSQDQPITNPKPKVRSLTKSSRQLQKALPAKGGEPVAVPTANPSHWLVKGSHQLQPGLPTPHADPVAVPKLPLNFDAFRCADFPAESSLSGVTPTAQTQPERVGPAIVDGVTAKQSALSLDLSNGNHKSLPIFVRHNLPLQIPLRCSASQSGPQHQSRESDDLRGVAHRREDNLSTTVGKRPFFDMNAGPASMPAVVHAPSAPVVHPALAVSGVPCISATPAVCEPRAPLSAGPAAGATLVPAPPPASPVVAPPSSKTKLALQRGLAAIALTRERLYDSAFN